MTRGARIVRRAGWLAALLLVPAAATAELRALVVAGLGGTEEYELEFQRHARAVADGVREVAGEVTLLLGEMSSRERLRSELTNLGTRNDDGTLLLVLIGHGSYDERDYRFNVPGPDVTGAELAEWLDALTAPAQIVVAATSASGALQELLKGESRTVMTATRSGGERNATVFPRFYAGALETPSADTDKDGYVSAVEAFRFAEAGVAAYYADHDRMATEHPTLAGAEADPVLASLDVAPALPPPDAAGGRLAELEADIDALRARKGELETDAYYAELQRLLVELAMVRSRDRGGQP